MFDYGYVCPANPDEIWHCIPVWNALKKQGELAVVMSRDMIDLFSVLFPSIKFFSPKDFIEVNTKVVAAGGLSESSMQWESVASPTYSGSDPYGDEHCHLAIMNLRNARLDIWTPDYSCEYQPEIIEITRRTGLPSKEFIDMIWSDQIGVDKFSWVSHLRALLHKPQVVVWDNARSLFRERPLHKDTRIVMEKTSKPVRCSVFMLTHKISLDVLEKAIDTTLAGIGEKDTLTVIATKAGDEIKNFLRQKKIHTIFISENLYFLNFNFAAEISQAEYVCFLNDDIVSESGWLNTLIGEMQRSRADFGGYEMSGGRFLPAAGKFEHIGWGRCGEKNYIDGWCICANRQVFLDIGGFSLWIWGALRALYSEDADLSFKAKEAGKVCVVVQPPQIRHLRHRTERNAEMVRSDKENNNYLFKRWNGVKLPGYILERYVQFQKFQINLGSHRCLGDALTGMAAAVQIAEATGKCEICNPPFEEVLHAYQAPNVQITDKDEGWQNYMANIVQYHLTPKDEHKHGNYVGAMMAAAGYRVEGLPRMICPPMPILDALKGINYAVLQPVSMSNHANDLSRADLESLIRYIKDHYALEVVISGKPAPHTPTDIPGAIYCLGDALNYCSAVAHAKLALGSESAIAHLAAGYNIPMVMWIRPERQPFMWLFNYPGWKKTICRNDLASVKEALQ